MNGQLFQYIPLLSFEFLYRIRLTGSDEDANGTVLDPDDLGCELKEVYISVFVRSERE